MFERTDGVHGRIGRLERTHQLTEPQTAVSVGAVGIEDHDLSTVLLARGIEIDADGIVERRLPSGLQPPDALEEAREIALRIAAASHVAREVDERGIDDLIAQRGEEPDRGRL